MSETAPPMTLTMEQAIERLGTGKFQRRMVIALGMCAASDAMEILLLSFLSIVVQHEYNVSPNEGSLLTSIVFIGAMLGTLILGRMGDRLGRKPIFLVSAAIVSLAGLLTAASQSYGMILACRFFVGFGLGGVVIPFDTLTEIMPAKERGRWLLSSGYFWSIGTVLTPVLAYLGLQEEGSWRVFVLLCSIPCVISTILAVFWVPESPRWLAAKGREAKALEILRKAAQQNGKDPMVAFPPEVRLIQDPNEETMHSYACLFKKEWRWLTISIWAVWLGKSFMYWGTVQLVTLVFSDENPDDLEANQSYSFDYGAILAASLAEVVGQTLAIALVEKGRRTPQSILYVLTGLAAIGLCLFAAQAYSERAVLILFAFLARMFSQGATSLTWLITAEILPTQIRNTGHSTASAVAKIGGALSPWLMSKQNSFQTIAIVYGIVTVWVSASVCCLPETSGRALGTAGSSSFLEPDTTKATAIV